MNEIQCNSCKAVKPVDEFHRRYDRPEGTRSRYNSYCKVCVKNYNSTPERRAARAAAAKRSASKLIYAVIQKLGGQCVCCGESSFLFLTLDHIEGNGAEHRKSKRGDRRDSGNVAVYRDVVKEGYPTDKYRVLCFNCNCGRARNGGACPHGNIR